MPLVSLLLQAAPVASVLGLAALGEALVERSGRVNLGLEGMLYLAYGVAGYAAVATGSLAAALAASAAAAAVMALVFYVLVELLHVDQIVVGLSLVFIGVGLGDVAGKMSQGMVGPSLSGAAAAASELLALAVLPLLLHLLLYRSSLGYRLRACGENEAAARFLGVPVERLRLAALLAEALLTAAAGVLLLSLHGGVWRPGYSLGWGWLALGAVIVGYWTPLGAAAASAAIGLLMAVRPLLPAHGVPVEVANIAPYAVVVAVLAAAGVVYRRLGVTPPALIWRE